MTCLWGSDGKLTCSVFTGADVKKTGACFALGNLVLLTLWLELNLFSFFIGYGIFILFIFGAVVHFGKVMDENMFVLENVVTQEQVSGFAGKMYACVSACSKKVAPLVFWADVQSSVVILAAAWFGYYLVGCCSLTGFALFAFNFLFFYGKFQDQIIPFAAPHVAKGKEIAGKYIAMVPRSKST